MKPSALRRVEREIRALIEKDGDKCSLCAKSFPHNSRSFGGVTKGGETALVGECCGNKLKQVILKGVYSGHGYGESLPSSPPKNATALSGHKIDEAIAAIQSQFRKRDQFAVDMVRRGGAEIANPKLQVGDSEWKRDDATWFKENPNRTHRLRDAFPKELEVMQEGREEKLVAAPLGHNYQILVRQIAPGQRMRHPFCRNLSTPIPDVDSILHAIFDLHMTAHETGRVITTSEIASLALKYEKAKTENGPKN